MSKAQHRLDDTLDIPTPDQLRKIEAFARDAHEKQQMSPKGASVQYDLERTFPGGFTHCDEANALIAMTVRNGPIEKLHAGKHSEWLEDQTLSRVTDQEMRILMINARRMLAMLLKMRDESPDVYRQFIQTHGDAYCGSWERK